MFEVRVYAGDGAGLRTWRNRIFNTYSQALDWANRVLAAHDLDEYEKSEEFQEIGEYPITELFYEII